MRFLRNTIYIIFFINVSGSSALSQDLSLVFGNYSGEMGDTICVDLTVENFEGVSSMEWRTRFDPSILRYINLDLTTSAMNGGVSGNLLFSGDFNLVQGDNGYITIAWANGPPEGVTLNDGDILYTICFEIIGDPCETSILATNGNPNVITITIAELSTGSDIPLLDSEINLVSGDVTVDPDGLFISESHCSTDDGFNTGSVTFAGSGGNGPYSWTLTGNGVIENGSGLLDCETATIDNLGPGTYSLTITDASNVVRNESITIVENSAFPFVLTLDGINPTCFDKENGTILIDNIVGGEGVFTYEWSNQNFVDDTIDDLLPGEYSLTITDENGCSTTSSYLLEADTVGVEIIVFSDPSCDGSSDGIVTFIASGGTPYPNGGYDYDVDGSDPFYIANGNMITPSFSPANFPEGCFEVVVIDDQNCQSDPVEFCLEAGSFSTLIIDTTNVSCFGNCDGAVLISAATSGNFSFQVFDSSGMPLVGVSGSTTFEAISVCPGTYMATITDNLDGCFIDTMFIIGEPLLLELMVLDSIGPGCSGGDGMISFDATGGTMLYTYLWDDAFDQPVRTNMSGGTYSVTVTDMNGCQDSIMWAFAEGGDIGLNAGVLNAISCESAADGEVRATVTAPGLFTFSWEDDNGVSLGDGQIIVNLGGGIYHVTATDGICTDTASVILASGQTPSATVVMTSPTCNNSEDGMLSASLADGVAQAMWEWNVPPSTVIISNGPVINGGVGLYNLHIIDANGCESDQLFEILPSIDSIEVTISNLTENGCFGSCNAGATFTAVGGPAATGDYTFIINGNAIPATLGSVTVSDLCAGINYVIALDGICFTDTIFFEVADVTEIMIDIANSTISPPACDGGDDGSIEAVITGGNNSNYNLLWINEGIMGSDLSNLSSGEYILEITDGNGCIVNDTIELITSDPLMVQVNPLTTTDISCFSGAMGRIGLSTSGGNDGVLTFAWSPDVSTTSFAENLAPGIYNVTVTDVNGCTDTATYQLTSAPPIVATIPTPAEPDCFGETTCVGIDNVVGGVGNNFTFTINNSSFRLPIDSCFTLFAGPCLITVFDSAGCGVDTMITIQQPSQVTVDLGGDITIDLGSSSDPISALIISELDIDSITWNPTVDIECNTSDCQIVTFSPNQTTSYTITVTDESGCLATDDINVLVDLTRNVYTPNIFSPESNNQNDHFQIVAGNGVTMVNYLKIYDRWGNLVYVDENYMPNDTQHIGWDGTRNGAENESGVYIFFAEVEFVDGVSIVYKGDVTLVR